MIGQVIVNALIAGSIYSLVAVGYTLVYGSLNFINFAHAEVFMSGAYFYILFDEIFRFPFPLSIIGAIICSVILGLAIERLAYRPLRWKSRLSILITAIGVSVVLQNIFGIIAGYDTRTINFPFQNSIYVIMRIHFTKYQVIIFGTLLIIGLTMIWFMHSAIGIRIRAVGENLRLAMDSGIDIDHIIALVFAIASGLAAIGGILIGLIQDVSPVMGVNIGLKAFVAAVVGGIGNIKGALIGGILIGLFENIAVAILPSGYKDGVVFALLLAIIFIRSRGLLGKSDYVEVT